MIDETLFNSITFTPILDSLKLLKIEDKEYFGNGYTQYVSNSRLSLINPEQGGSPEMFFGGLEKNAQYSDALIFGSAVHELILQPELFELVTSVNRPTAKLGFMADDLFESYLNDLVDSHSITMASDRIGYYKGKMNPDRIKYVIDSCSTYWEEREQYENHEKKSNKTPIYLDPKSRERVLSCVEALNRNKSIQKLLHPQGIFETPISENEQAILLDIEVNSKDNEPFILHIKAKLDNFTIDTETNSVVVNDVKTIGKVVSEFNNNFTKFHYNRELALYSWLISLAAKKYYNIDCASISSNCLVVSTIPQYYTKVYTLSKADFSNGWNEFKYLLKLVAYYHLNGYEFERHG